MIDVVLDTNLLVSALWSKDGNPARIAHLIPDRIISPCYCFEIVSEYGLVLSLPNFHFHQNNIIALLDNIVKFGKAVTVIKSSITILHEADRVFYDTAKTSGSILITGNIKHFPSEPFIMSPAEFLCNIGSL